MCKQTTNDLIERNSIVQTNTTKHAVRRAFPVFRENRVIKTNGLVSIRTEYTLTALKCIILLGDLALYIITLLVSVA